MFDKIKNEYKDNLLKSFNDSDWVFFKYIIESVPEIMLAYRNKDGDLQLNKDYIALLALLVVSLGPSRELILNMKHAKSLRELYDIVADEDLYKTRIGKPSLKLLQLLVSDTWPQLAELFTDDESTRDLLLKHGDIAEALIPMLRMRGTEDSFRTVLKKYIPHNNFAPTGHMGGTIQVNAVRDFYDNKQLYDLLLWMKPVGYFLNVSDRKLPIFANNLKALITNRSINKQWVKNMSRYMDPLPGADFAAPIIHTYTIRTIPSYLTFQSDGPFTLSTDNQSKNWDGTLYYSTDTTTWNEWDGTTIYSVNNKLYLRGTGNKTITGGDSTARWVLTGTNGSVNIECLGNIEVLLDYNKRPTMSNNCYSYMFQGCTSLTTAPELPATALAPGCYRSMFQGCINLTAAPELPATILKDDCYNQMFGSCTSLTEAPELPATTLASYCYANMFQGCTSLTEAPELPATTLASYCYRDMFSDCTSLTAPPRLPAATLAPSCYRNMFKGCISLTTVPWLPAITMSNSCYRSMFENCLALKVSTTKIGDYKYAWRIPTITPTDKPATEASNWNTNMFVGTGGTFKGSPTINTTYYIENHPLAHPSYLTFQSDGPFRLRTDNVKQNWDGTLYYSTDTATWNIWDGTTIYSVNNKLYLRGIGNTIITGHEGAKWRLSGTNDNTKIECIGNIEMLLDWEKVIIGDRPTMADSCYYSMFQGCTSLTTAPKLPAAVLTLTCYAYMFAGCTNLTTAPELPATTLEDSCYYGMFKDCTSLTTVPSLPATTLVADCYYYMFHGCASLEVSTSKDEDYKYAWRIPTSGAGTTEIGWNTGMLAGTGGTFKGSPTINTTYYIKNPPVPFSLEPQIVPQSDYPKELYVEFDSAIYEDYKAILQVKIEYRYPPELTHEGDPTVTVTLESEKAFTSIIPSGDLKTQNISVNLPKLNNYTVKSIKVTLKPLKPIRQGDKREVSTFRFPDSDIIVFQ